MTIPSKKIALLFILMTSMAYAMPGQNLQCFLGKESKTYPGVFNIEYPSRDGESSWVTSCTFNNGSCFTKLEICQREGVEAISEPNESSFFADVSASSQCVVAIKQAKEIVKAYSSDAKSCSLSLWVKSAGDNLELHITNPMVVPTLKDEMVLSAKIAGLSTYSPKSKQEMVLQLKSAKSAVTQASRLCPNDEIAAISLKLMVSEITGTVASSRSYKYLNSAEGKKTFSFDLNGELAAAACTGRTD